MGRNEATDIILGIVTEIKTDLKEVKTKQAQISEDISIFHEIHVNCPGKQAKKILDEKGMRTIVFFSIHPKLMIATIIGLIILSLAGTIGTLRAGVQVQQLKDKIITK
jgi:hypothetical protein